MKIQHSSIVFLIFHLLVVFSLSLAYDPSVGEVKSDEVEIRISLNKGRYMEEDSIIVTVTEKNIGKRTRERECLDLRNFQVLYKVIDDKGNEVKSSYNPGTGSACSPPLINPGEIHTESFDLLKYYEFLKYNPGKYTLQAQYTLYKVKPKDVHSNGKKIKGILYTPIPVGYVPSNTVSFTIESNPELRAKDKVLPPLFLGVFPEDSVEFYIATKPPLVNYSELDGKYYSESSPKYKVGEPVIIDVVLKNKSKTDISVPGPNLGIVPTVKLYDAQRHRSPNPALLTLNDNYNNYKEVKRKPIENGDFMTLVPGDSLAFSFNLSEHFTFTLPSGKSMPTPEEIRRMFDANDIEAINVMMDSLPYSHGYEIEASLPYINLIPSKRDPNKSSEFEIHPDASPLFRCSKRIVIIP
jgi:hypothetical protein